MISNAEIRARARENLGGDIFQAKWLYPVLLLFIISAISGAVAGTYVGPIVLAGVLACATSGYFLGRVRENLAHDQIGSALDFVKNDLTGSMIAGILVNLITGIGYILLIFPGIILSYSYAMVFFVRIDNPGMGVWESLKESARLMQGHKMSYFKLQLSFIGWIILSALCLGIGTLWVSAYINTANAIFYEELIAQDQGYYNATASECED